VATDLLLEKKDYFFFSKFLFLREDKTAILLLLFLFLDCRERRSNSKAAAKLLQSCYQLG